ncbi:MAG: amidase [Cyclobacteriaceae bacterium]
MKRRDFLLKSALAGCVLPSALLNSCQNSSPGSPASGQDDTDDPFELKEVSIEALQQKMEKGEYTSRVLVEMYLRRIKEIDQDGSRLNSVIEVNPDALAIAEKLDEERRSGRVRSVLHGIPFLVKDNIDTGDRMMTTAGSLALSGHHATEDAPIVGQLREAGAVLIGKTNLSEWANFRSTRSSSGWSSRGGQTKNPYSLERNPCGSSSGSGVAVAANLCSFAIGTETNGSISCPSSINGIVGLKPTVGLVSRTGIIPISKTQDTAGPMTRTVRETALILNAITAADEKDAATLQRPRDIPRDYLSFLEVEALRGKRIGVEKSFLRVHEKVDALLQQALEQMKSRGATIVEVDFVKKLKDAGESEYKVLQFEFKDGLNRYLAARSAPVKSLKDIIAFNNAHADSVMPFFRQEILEASEGREDLNSDDYKNALNSVITTSREAIDGVMREHRLHAICGPATGAAWCTDVVNGDSFSGYGMGSGAAMAGYPSITVPLGDVYSLPVGILFIGRAYGEGDLLGIAYAYEQASRNRKPPAFLQQIL